MSEVGEDSALELRVSFKALQSRRDVASLLDVQFSKLCYHIYAVPEAKRYTAFTIEKRSGGSRVIRVPHNSLKAIQTRLANVLLAVYRPKPCVHSYLKNKSIVSNARDHVGKRHVLRVDIEDFFPSINFGRVRGLFLGKPYLLPKDVATILAQIICHDNQLPQGSPSSPIVSNMICARLDAELMRLAKAQKCNYSRYADDITFSTNLRRFPTPVATGIGEGGLELGVELRHVIESNGFKINATKSSLNARWQSQRVTGITVNKRLNIRRELVRQIRAMIHAWTKYGYDAAELEFRKKYDFRKRHVSKADASFGRVLRGRIEYLGMIRGKSDDLYRKFLSQLHKLNPDLVRADLLTEKCLLQVITEGPSDKGLLMAALEWFKTKGRYRWLELEFPEEKQDIGYKQLLKSCEVLCKFNQQPAVVAVFDRDVTEVLELHKNMQYKNWGKSVYSVVLPVPPHRTEKDQLSIEHYFRDEEITREDAEGHRLYFVQEFHQPGGAHRTHSDIHCVDAKGSNGLRIVDSQVFRGEASIALTKRRFAEYVRQQERGFHDFDCSPFAAVFDLMQAICQASRLGAV